MFQCDCCGLCCMNLKMSELYSDLDRGDGICRYLDVASKLCTIYRNRPDKCNVDKTYEKFYKDKITLEQAKAQIEEKNIETLNRTIMQLRIRKN